MFRCPSDVGQCWQSIQVSAYNDVGTSYQANWHWWDQLIEDHPGEEWDSIISKYPIRFYRQFMEKAPDRFILLMEDPADLAFNWGPGGSQLQGWHGEFSWHAVGYADGSARYQYMDTRHGHDSVPDPPGPRHGKYENLGVWSVVDWQNDHFSNGRHL